MPDLQTCVAVSMLPLSRARAASTFNSVRHCDSSTCARGSPRWLPRAARVVAGTHRAGARPHGTRPERGRGCGDRARAAGRPPVPGTLGLHCDPPPVLWTRGELADLARPAVAVVGSRAATPYALEVAQRLGEELAARDVVVVSGLARGVDSAAHRGSLAGGGPTVAVLGSGLDCVYPPEHDGLAVSICSRGVLRERAGPGGRAAGGALPPAQSDHQWDLAGVVVVEASEKSGSLITARCALEQGRDVMAVPGSILSGRNRGSHALLKDGAKVVETADDILEELGWPSSARVPWRMSP